MCFSSVSVAFYVLFEEIILVVQSKPEISMSSHPLYKNGAVGKKVWSHIAKKLGIEVNNLYSVD